MLFCPLCAKTEKSPKECALNGDKKCQIAMVKLRSLQLCLRMQSTFFLISSHTKENYQKEKTSARRVTKFKLVVSIMSHIPGLEQSSD